MSGKRNVIIKVRVYPEQAERWRTAAIKAGATDLSTFIRDLVDEEIQWEAFSQEEMLEAQRALNLALTQTLPVEEVQLRGFLGKQTEAYERSGSVTITNDPVFSNGDQIAEVAELADAPDSSPGSLGSEGSTPSLGTIIAAIPDGVVCPRKFTHRAGVYCTACGFTPE